MEMFVVGEKFPRMVNEGVTAVFDGNKIEVIIGLRNISESEHRGFMNGEIEFYLSYVNDVFFLCMRVEELMDLSDMPVRIAVDNGVKPRAVHKGREGYPVFVFLVDAKTEIHKGTRVIGLSNDMSRNLNLVLEDMKGIYPEIEEYDKNCLRTMGMLSTEQIKNFAFSEYKSSPK